ncbi:response regulator transcription factor [Aliarcobacter lanthieri]|uniref:response regulator transcription factor n=1 Tax=Aliarcobacter lanthieri TaxID=1355374 RepID=UPI00047D7654|nr:response regulator transcription factor [Aliarcobacter lanthieri]
MLDYMLLNKYCKEITVLFVEDDEDLSREMGLLLKDIFSNVDIAMDGIIGLSKYIKYFEENSKYYDFILTDIQMPNMNGVDLIKNIYKINPNQKVIVLSAHSEKEYLMELINIGIAKFLLKPIDYDNFLNVLFDISKNIYEKNHKKDIKSTIIKLSDELFWNKEEKQLILKDKVVKLTRKEFLFVELLIKYPNKIHSNENIINHIWNYYDSFETQILNLKNLISRLRKKVPMLVIQNNYGFGYSIEISE